MKSTLAKLMLGLFCALLFHPVSEALAQRQRVNGTLVNIGGRQSGRTRPFSLIINSYTAPNQVRELNDALQRGGQDELLKALSNMDAGRIQLGTGVGVRANAIIAEPWGEGGTSLPSSMNAISILLNFATERDQRTIESVMPRCF